ncbi:MAG: hypothetical protein HUU10_15755 [Bacteroidetes bacterium]|nr:hypothetical protein [Bacteroidota bacterium]
MKVRAKFFCHSVFQNDDNKTAHLHAVYGHQGENADFTRHTPAGSLSIAIDKDVPAASFFEQGKSYYLDFSQAE